MTKKKLKIKPTGHHVLVKPEKMEKVSEGGIILQDDMINRENTAKVRGTIAAVGKNAWKDFGGEAWAKVGDSVYFKRHVSDMVEDKSDIGEDGKPQTYFLMADENILAVIED